MTSPLSPAQDAVLNSGSSVTKRKYDDYDMMLSPKSGSPGHSRSSRSGRSGESGDAADQENVTPLRNRHGRVMSGTELSPLRMVESQGEATPSPRMMRGGARKMSPEKRFPVKVSGTSDGDGYSSGSSTINNNSSSNDNDRRGARGATHERTMSDEEKAVMLEDAVPDESVMSTFSAFSAVPLASPRASRRDGSPVKSAHRTPASSSVGMLMETAEATPWRRGPHMPGSLSPSKSMSSMAAAAAAAAVQTPSREPSKLVDFDIPPMPTPRSVPSITPRELESLRSKLLSEISSLKASLSGKEAEVQSLKAAIGDAEKRVGQTWEQVREERALKEQLAGERDGWEQRGREMDKMVRKMREELVAGQREREELERQVEESDKRREAAEMMHQEAESKLAGLRAGKEKDSPERLRSSVPTTSSSSSTPTPTTSNREVEVAVERVARELHVLYKSKHETKVAALKKSYENRWEKKVRGLEGRIEDLQEENDKLRAGPLDPNATLVRMEEAEAKERKAQGVRDKATIKELNAGVQRLEAVVGAVKKDNEELRRMLQQERVEKGELVQLAEELMGMQQTVPGTPAPQRKQEQEQQVQQEQELRAAKAPAAAGRSSGLRAPGASGLRAPGGATGGGLPRPGVRGGMSSMGGMGQYRGRE